MGHGAKKRAQRLDAKRSEEPTQEQRAINQALGRNVNTNGPSTPPKHQQQKHQNRTVSIEQVKNDGNRLNQRQGRTATLIHYDHISHEQLKTMLSELNLQPVNVLVHDTPNPKTGQYSSLVEMETFDQAATVIHQGAKLANIVHTKWSAQSKIKSRFTPKPPPSPEHRAIMIQYTEHKDENQIRNLAMLVAPPTAVRVPNQARDPSKGYFAFVEMETQAQAIELLALVPREPGFRAFWAKNPNIQANNSWNKTVDDWGAKTKLTLVTNHVLEQSKLDELIGSHPVKSVKLAAEAVNGEFFSLIEFETSDEARQFYKSQMTIPTKGLKLVVEHILEHREHMPLDEVKRLLESGDLAEGELRVPKSKYDRGYVSNPANRNDDYVIVGRGAMNRALTGDTVAIRILPEAAWERDGDVVRKTAEVVRILSKRLVQSCSGSFSCRQLYPAGQPGNVLFEPMDSRLPRILIPIDSLKEGQLENIVNTLQAKTLFEVEIKEWKEGSQYTTGALMQTIGDPSDLDNLMKSLLVNNGIDTAPIEPQIEAGDLPPSEWTIPAQEIAKRRDFRKECVFTIDPLTARDLDDALHVKKMSNGNFEVGVHIADVSYFVKPKGKIDEIASSRCTSTYMPDRVVSMLPRRLCEDLCSLNPSVDRLSYSVVFEMSPEGKRVGTPWYGRGIIRSCGKLAYEHAQMFIDEKNNGVQPDFTYFPTLHGGYEIPRIRECVLNLAQLARGMRSTRVANGCVRIEQVKVGFVWDPETKMPVGFHPYTRKESHKLIEEFMLAANIAVAEKLHQELPELAFLRQHEAPEEDKADELEEWMKTLGMKSSMKSAKAVAESLRNLFDKAAFKITRDNFDSAMSLRVVKIMQLAKYKCIGAVDGSDYSHYALAVPLYTHFTSPIRRMADLVVHRQLSAALGDSTDVDTSEYDQGTLAAQAEMCNKRKSNAKSCGEEGSEVYMWAFIKSKSAEQEFIMEGIIVDLVEHGFEVLILQTGSVIRCYYGEMEIVKWEEKTEKSVKCVKIDWAMDQQPLGRNKMRQPVPSRRGEKAHSQTLSYFSLVNVVVQADLDKPGKLMGTIKPSPEAQEMIRSNKQKAPVTKEAYEHLIKTVQNVKVE